MSDRDRRNSAPVGGAGRPGAVSHPEQPQGEAVEGSIAVRSESPREFVLSESQLNQLKLHLGEVLRPEPEPELPMFGELAAVWLASIATKRVEPRNEERQLKHLRLFFLENERTLLASAVDDHLSRLVASGALSASTANKVRNAGRLAVDHARAQHRWAGPNPFQLVKRRKERQRKYELLTLDELARLQSCLRADRRREFRVQLHLGLRPGELFALRKEDVNWEAGSIHIHRSHGRAETKTGKERVIPILPAIAADLLEAYRTSSSDLVFPRADGTQQNPNTKLAKIFHTAMAKAGVGIVSVTYKCRRRGCLWSETVEENSVREVDCPRCEFTCQPVPKVRAVRWYDLRHMCSTFHHAHHADPLCVALALGHAVKQTTAAVYTHPNNDMMLRELSRWKLPG